MVLKNVTCSAALVEGERAGEKCGHRQPINTNDVEGQLLWECRMCGGRNVVKLSDGPSHAAITAEDALDFAPPAAFPGGMVRMIRDSDAGDSTDRREA